MADDFNPGQVYQAFLEQSTHPDVLRGNSSLGAVETDPLNSTEGKFGGDEAIKAYTKHVGDLYEKRMTDLGQPFKDRSQLEAEVGNRTRRYAIERLSERYKEEGYTGRGTTEYIGRRIVPFAGALQDVGQSVEMGQAQQAFQEGRAGWPSYHTVARNLAQQQSDQERGFTGRAVDVASQLPATALEWLASGGTAAAPEVAASAGAKGLIGQFAKRAAIQGGGTILKQAPLMPLRVGAEAAARMGPTPLLDEQGLKFQKGEDFPEAFAKSVGGDVVTRGIFGGLGAFETNAGKSFLRGTAEVVGAGELDADTKKLLSLTPQGGPLWRLGTAETTEERYQALAELTGTTLGAGLFEAGVKVAGRAKAEGRKEPTKAQVKEALNGELQKAAAQATKPPEPGAPSPSDQWHDTYKNRREADYSPEQAKQAADLQHEPNQTWQHTGTEFTDEGEFQAGGKTWKIEQLPPDKEGSVVLRTVDENGKQGSRVSFDPNEDGSFSGGVLGRTGALAGEARTPGLARALYDYMHDSGATIRPSDKLSEDGKSFWQKNAEHAAGVSGVEGSTPATPREQANQLEAQHLDALRALQDAQRRELRAKNELAQGFNRASEVKQAQQDRLAAEKKLKGLRDPLDKARVAAAAEEAAKPAEHIVQHQPPQGPEAGIERPLEAPPSPPEAQPAPTPAQAAPAAPAGRMTAEELHRRLSEGEDIPGLTKTQAKDLLLHHVQGKTLDQVGSARGVTREAARQSIEKALEKLHDMIEEPPPGTVAERAPEQIVSPDELPARWVGKDRHEEAMNELVQQLEQEMKQHGGRLPSDRVQFWNDELTALSDEQASGKGTGPALRRAIARHSAVETTPAPDNAGEPSPVRPSDGGEVSPSGTPVAPVPAEQATEGGAGGGKGAPAGPEAARDELSEANRIHGEIPAATIGRLKAAVAAGDRVQVDDIKKVLGGKSVAKRDVQIKDALEQAGKFPEGVEGPTKRSSLRGTGRQNEAGLRLYEQEQQILREIAAHEAAKLPPGTAAEAIQRAEEVGLSDARKAAGIEPSEDTSGLAAEPPLSARPDIGDFAFGANMMPEGMGAAGGGGPSPPAPGAPGATTAEPPPQSPKPSAGWFQTAKDWLKSFAQQSYPALTRLSRTSGEKLAEASNAPAAAKSAWDYFSNILTVNGTPLAKLPEAERQELGATWLERRMRAYRQKLLSLGKDASQVRTLVGQPGSPLQNEAQYQENLRGLFGFFEGVKQEWTPEVEKNYRGLKGLEADEGIDSLSQIPGLPLNAISLRPEDVGKPGVVGTGTRQGMENLRLRRPGFMRAAELSAPAYDVDVAHMMQRTLNTGIPAARRAEFVKTAIDEGVMAAVTGAEKPPEGFKYLGIDPARGLPGLDASSRYYVDPAAYRDVIQGLGIGERPGQTIASGLRPITDKLYNIALMSPVELATHMANHMTALFRPGMGVPIYNLKDTFANAWDLYKKDPAMLEKVKDLAAISASFGHEAKPGLLGENLKKYDPTAYMNKVTSGLIDTMQKAVRIQLSDAYDKMVEAGHFPDTETGKRDFINQAVGNYNTQAGNRLAQFLKDSGLQSFAVAAHTFGIQGAKSLWGGAINAPATSAASAAQLRGTAIVKMLPFLAIGPVLNAISWGNAFPKNIPAFAVKTRDDEDGKSHYFDPLAFTGVRRGARMTGVNALVSGALEGKTGGQMADQAVKDAMRSGEHMLAGPPVQFLHTLATGEDAMGHKVATPVSKAKTAPGIGAAERKGLAAPGSSEYWENLKAAAAGANPVVKSLVGERGRPRTWWENIMQSAGPFGEKTGTVQRR